MKFNHVIAALLRKLANRKFPPGTIRQIFHTAQKPPTLAQAIRAHHRVQITTIMLPYNFRFAHIFFYSFHFHVAWNINLQLAWRQHTDPTRPTPRLKKTNEASFESIIFGWHKSPANEAGKIRDFPKLAATNLLWALQGPLYSANYKLDPGPKSALIPLRVLISWKGSGVGIRVNYERES